MNYNEQQLEAIKSRGNVALLASSGSGKSAVVIERIASLIEEGVNTENILSISFSKEAVTSLERRLSDRDIQGVNVKTFHALAWQIVKNKDPRWKLFEQTWEKEKCIETSLKNNGYKFAVKEDIPFNEIYRFIATQKHLMVKNDKCVKVKSMSLDFNILKSVYTDYERYRKSKFYVEFDDMVNIAVDMLERDSDYLAEYQNMYKYILIDETQDISKNQFVLMSMLNKSNEMFIVGDAKQSIYKFRHSDPTYLVDYDKYADNVKFINMNINYRSTDKIVYLSNRIAEHDSVSKNKNYVEAVANKSSDVTPEYVRYINEDNMLIDIKDRICKYIENGYKYSDILILTRTNAELQNYESLFAVNDIPYKTFNNRCFLDNPEIKLVASYLLLANDVNDNDSFVYLVNKPNRYLGKDFINSLEGDSLFEAMADVDPRIWKWRKGIDELTDIIHKLQTYDWDNVGDMVRYLRKRMNIDSFVATDADDVQDNKIDSLDRFERICSRFHTLERFKAFTREVRTKSNKKSDDKVSLMTAHKSKGLEYPIVFVTGLNEEQFPHSKCDEEDMESELRLFYVACTRAGDILIITSAKNVGSYIKKQSRFIEYLGDSVNVTLYPDMKNKT